jgi:hypothetical protein
MTALQEGTAYARGKGGESFKEPRTWAEAPAPAQLAKKALGPRIVKRQAPHGLGVAGAFAALDR